jgi:hypothetical protein
MEDKETSRRNKEIEKYKQLLSSQGYFFVNFFLLFFSNFHHNHISSIGMSLESHMIKYILSLGYEEKKTC